MISGQFDSLGKFASFGWYMIVGWARLASQPEHPFVSPEWIETPGQGVYRVDSEQEPVLLARRALFI